MLIYNVTLNVDDAIKTEWIDWMKHEHIPDMMETGCFDGYKFLRVITEVPDATGSTFAVQYFCQSRQTLTHYITTHAKSIRNKHKARYPNQIVAFRTTLEEVV
jgi:hypothetical protein